MTMHAHAGASRNKKQALTLKPKTAALYFELIDYQARKTGRNELASCNLKQTITCKTATSIANKVVGMY